MNDGPPAAEPDLRPDAGVADRAMHRGGLPGPVAPVAACFAKLDIESRRSVVVAVSGGSDSLALLLLLRQRLAAMPAAMLAVTVDHGLRAEAAAEADQVARLCARLGIRHATMRWIGDKPATGVMQAARLARYRLLAEAADAAGTDLVLTGHTADDLAETVAMRAARSAGPGLAGIAPASLWKGRVWFARPLLGARRADLQTFLRRAGIGWTSDPSNADPRFERARLRKALAAADRERLIAEGMAAAAAREAASRAAARLIEEAARIPSPGLVRLDRALLTSADEPAAVHALRLLLAVTGGREHLPDAARVSALLDALRAGPLRRAIAGTVIEARREAIHLHREWRGGGPAPATLGLDGGVFDHRFRLCGPAGAVVAAFGQSAGEALEPPPGAPERLARAARACEPRLPDGVAARRLLSPFASLLPSFDLAAARALARLFATREPPGLP